MSPFFSSFGLHFTMDFLVSLSFNDGLLHYITLWVSKTMYTLNIQVFTISINISLGSDALTTDMDCRYLPNTQPILYLPSNIWFSQWKWSFPDIYGYRVKEIIVIRNDIVSTLIITLFISLKTNQYQY